MNAEPPAAGEPPNVARPRSLDVSLSYNDQDKRAVQELATHLQGTGLRAWLSDEPQGALRLTQACALFLGPAGWGTRQLKEAKFAFRRHAVDHSYNVVLVLLPGVRDEFLAALPDWMKAYPSIDLRAGLDHRQLEKQLGWRVETDAATPSDAPPARARRASGLGRTPDRLPRPQLTPARELIQQMLNRARFPESRHPPRDSGNTEAPAPGDAQPGRGAIDMVAQPVKRAEPLGHAGGDMVDCSVFAAPTVAPGEAFLVQVVAHLLEQADLARTLAREFDQRAERRGFKTLAMEIERGGTLSFDLELPGLEIEDPNQMLVWQGVPQAVQFGVRVPDALGPQSIIGTLRVSFAAVPIGHIKFHVEVVQEHTLRPRRDSEALGESARFYRLAFVSYASQDRTEVLKRVQMLSIVRIPFFQDVLDLEPGQRWERAVYRHIDESDLFLLFWSTAAKQSEWVRKEVQYALERKKGDAAAPPEIIPVPIEGPPPVPPPEELAALHFNDRLLYFMQQGPA
jgi:hypothetical protein